MKEWIRRVQADAIVIGSGVIGLSTAIRLQEAGLHVEIWTAALPQDTTSSVAAATWFPYNANPRDHVLNWGEQTYSVFEEMAEDSTTGVQMRECVQLWRDPMPEPWWGTAVPDLRRYAEDELLPGYRDSYVFTQPVIEMPVYLQYLLKRFNAAHGRIKRTLVWSIEEVARIAKIVINCTGLEARKLVGDDQLTPVRGQIVRVRNPGLDRCVSDLEHPDGMAYIVPRSEDCILGGTADEGHWNIVPDQEVAAGILRRCAEIEPRIADASVLEHKVGLRPVRSAIRLEREDLADGAYCIHNYGHGGAGVTLSWGCAGETVSLVRQTLLA